MRSAFSQFFRLLAIVAAIALCGSYLRAQQTLGGITR